MNYYEKIVLKDPKSGKFKNCPAGCGGTDIRVHFTEKEGKPTSEKYHLHWCTKYGAGYNIKRGFVDAMIFESCVKQMNQFLEKNKNETRNNNRKNSN